MDAAYDKMGGFGKHQIKALLIQANMFMLGSFGLYPMGYYELQPEYECRYRGGDWKECTNEAFCPSETPMVREIPNYRVNTTSSASLENWV